MGSEIVERFKAVATAENGDGRMFTLDQAEVVVGYITALEAMCEKMAGYAEHDSDCVLSIPKAIRVRSSIQDKCTCGLSETLAQYREADNGRHLRISEEQSEALHNAQVASFDSFEPPLAIKEADNGR